MHFRSPLSNDFGLSHESKSWLDVGLILSKSIRNVNLTFLIGKYFYIVDFFYQLIDPLRASRSSPAIQFS
jgi:hypothetical protein